MHLANHTHRHTVARCPLLVARCSLLVARHMQQILDEHGVVIVTGVLDDKERLELERVWSCQSLLLFVHAAATTTATYSIAATATVASACSNS